MEINAANVELFFLRRQVSSSKKWMEKDKLGELPTKEVQEIKDNAVPVTTEGPQS